MTSMSHTCTCRQERRQEHSLERRMSTNPHPHLHPPHSLCAGYQPLTFVFFLLAFPINVFIKTWASLATILLCQRAQEQAQQQPGARARGVYLCMLEGHARAAAAAGYWLLLLCTVSWTHLHGHCDARQSRQLAPSPSICLDCSAEGDATAAAKDAQDAEPAAWWQPVLGLKHALGSLRALQPQVRPLPPTEVQGVGACSGGARGGKQCQC